jgi:hypothetical protein
VRTKSAPAPEDLRLLRSVNDLVEGKGSLPDLGPNGRHVGTIQRLTGEMRGYLGQGSHPALCTGVPDMLDFYKAQWSPLDRRADDLAGLARQIRSASHARTRDIAVAELRTFERTLGDLARQSGSALARFTKAVADGQTESLPAIAPLSFPNRPAEPAAITDIGLLGLPSLIREAARPLLPADALGAALIGPTPMAILTQVRARFLDPETKREPVADEVADTAIAALRLIEASVYADKLSARLKEADEAVAGTLAKVRAIHQGACTCQDGS